jgi:hypothetical protein
MLGIHHIHKLKISDFKRVAEFDQAINVPKELQTRHLNPLIAA